VGCYYLSLKINEELKLNFFIRTDYSVNNKDNMPELHDAVFRCSIRATGEHLAFELTEQDGTLIRLFWFDKQIAQGSFCPVVDEIQKHLYLGERNIAIQVANYIAISAT